MKTDSDDGFSPFRAALLVGVAYYVGARLGFLLTLHPIPVSTLWPPNSLLLAGLLLTPYRYWWALLLAALPAHLVVELQSGIPMSMVLGWFVSNCTEALIGAACVRYFVREPLRFDKFRDVSVFVLGAATLATLLSSFLDAGFVVLNHWGNTGYWEVVRTRFFSNSLASLTLVPVIVTWMRDGLAPLRGEPARRYVEAGVLTAGLLSVGFSVFAGNLADPNPAPVMLYAPLPFLLWAALRFGPRGISAALLLVSSLAIWGAVEGHGPFAGNSPAENALAVQLFLIVVSVLSLSLAAIMRERVVGERDARDYRERLNLGLEAAQVGTWEWDILRGAVFLSDKSSQIFGLSPIQQELSFNQFLGLVSPTDRATLSQAIQGAIEQRAPYECEFRIKRNDSGTSWVLSKGKALYDRVGRPEHMLGVNVDITERKANEELRREERALRESEARLRELADAMPQIVWSVRPDGQFEYFNRRWYELTGVPHGQIGQESWLPMTHPDDRALCVQALTEAVRTGEPLQVEHRIRVRATGKYRWHLARARPVRNEEGAVVRWYGTCTDIEDQKVVEQALRDARTDLERRVAERTVELSTAVVALQQEIDERVAIERALRSSEDRFGRAFHSSPDPMSIVGQIDSELIEVNERWEAMFGYSRQEAIGQTMSELGLFGSAEDRQAWNRRLEIHGPAPEFELGMRTREGDRRRAVMVAETVEMGGAPCFIIIIRDVTDRKRAEQEAQEQRRELAHLSRVASLGELSGALAHEVSQPLAAILANAQAAQRLLAREPNPPAEIGEILKDIVHDDQRAGQVIHRLRALLKKGELDPRPCDLNEVVNEVLQVMHSELMQRSVNIRTRLEQALPLVLADRVQLQQVLLNLIVNACDAMNYEPRDERQLEIVTAEVGQDSVKVSVIDQGIGIPDEKLEKVFSPFFTSKETGLGLGLAICRSIVTAHGGRLWAVNNTVRGATFHLVLGPASAQFSSDGLSANTDELAIPDLVRVDGDGLESARLSAVKRPTM
ncbi:MAG TPA: PAS domain S-box protein [Gemmatimonadales bacterium]|nr:PAS domain S-box protein [Gemmatimonadales bacterium]